MRRLAYCSSNSRPCLRPEYGERVSLPAQPDRTVGCQGFVYRYGSASRVSACIAIAVWVLGTILVAPSIAEEATTPPTCTGCSGSGVVKHRSKPQRSVRASPKAAARAVTNRPAINNDGSWSGVSTGPCIVTWRWSLDVINGTISGRKTTGQVSRTGSVGGAMVVFGKTYKFSGRFHGSVGSGAWRSAECSGTWTAAKS